MEKKVEYSKKEYSEQTRQTEHKEIGDTKVNEAAASSVIINVQQYGEEPSIELLETQPKTETRSKHDNKAKENVLDYLTEKQIADIFKGRQRVHWVFDGWVTFEDLSDRKHYILKVFGIVFLMLLATVVTCFHTYKSFWQPSSHVYRYFRIFSFVIPLVYAIAGGCLYKLRKLTPLNYFFLLIACADLTFLTCTITIHREVNELRCATGVTGLFLILCFVLAFSPVDCTEKARFVAMVAMIVFVVIFIIVYYVLMLGFKIRMPLWITNPLMLIFMGFFVVWIVSDLQMILGGKANEFDEEDYTFNAWLNYWTIILMFLCCLFLTVALFLNPDLHTGYLRRPDRFD